VGQANIIPMSRKPARVLIVVLVLAGCSAPLRAPSDRTPAARDAAPARPLPAATLGATADRQPVPYVPQIDSQGSVVFEVTPLGLSAAAETLEFAVVMNTHSIDLVWDLASLSVLRTDSGGETKGLSWPAGSGHHYSGTLTFAGRTPDGRPLLDGAQIVTLIIRDTDVPERTFTWEVSP
jgi:hypothetical protein